VDVNFLIYVQKDGLKILAKKTNQRKGIRRECFKTSPIKATGVCGLLNAYPGTQSGKLLGGKLANNKNQFSTMSLAKH